MTATAADPLTPVTLRWRLGEYLTAQGSPITHTYGAIGRYGVDVEALDAAGNSSRATRFIEVDQHRGPLPPPPTGNEW
jgi:hypothetical protein